MARGAIFRTARGAIFRMALSVPWGDEAPKRARLALMQTEEGRWRVEFDEPWAREGAKPPEVEVEAELEPAAPERDAA